VTQATISHSLAIQFRVIFALLMREVLTRYGRHNIGFLWLFFEPMIFTLGITALWTFTKQTHGSNLPIVAFAVTGYSAVLLWRNMPARCIGSLVPNLSLLYHRNVRPIDIFAARIFLEAIGGTASFVALCLLFVGLELSSPPESAPKIALGWALLIWFGGSLAIFLGALSQQFEVVERFWHPVAYLMFPLSGALFLVEWLPPAAQRLVLLLPMVHCVELIREGYFGSHIKAHYDLLYVAGFCSVLTLLALAQERRASRRLTLD